MTHEVLNQVPELEGHDLLASAPLLSEALAREGGGWGLEEVAGWGRTISQPAIRRLADEANRNDPVLRTHDSRGNRLDTVDFHPAWHELLRLSVGEGLHSLPFEHAPGEGGRVVRDAKFVLMSQIEQGHGCPISMTTSVLPALAADPAMHTEWGERIRARP